MADRLAHVIAEAVCDVIETNFSCIDIEVYLNKQGIYVKGIKLRSNWYEYQIPVPVLLYEYPKPFGEFCLSVCVFVCVSRFGG